jgi:hypothetical protein
MTIHNSTLNLAEYVSSCIYYSKLISRESKRMRESRATICPERRSAFFKNYMHPRFPLWNQYQCSIICAFCKIHKCLIIHAVCSMACTCCTYIDISRHLGTESLSHITLIKKVYQQSIAYVREREREGEGGRGCDLNSVEHLCLSLFCTALTHMAKILDWIKTLVMLSPGTDNWTNCKYT